MDMKTVKEIKLPNHLYKKLEYIKFNGAEYLYLPFDITSQYAYYATQVKPLSAGDIMGYSGTSTYEFEYRCVSNTNLTCKVLFGGGTSGTLAYQVTKQASDLLQISYKLDNGYRYSTYNVTTGNTTNFVDNSQYLNGPATFNSKGFYFGARNDSSNQFDRYCTMLLYSFYLDSNATSSSQHAQWYSYKDTNFIPVQRISDNVCGLYDIKHEVFYAMVGTEITTNAAGPFIGEYIDGTPLEVKKIEDSNGNIIWGSYDAFPYRRLRYVKFNGNDYVNTNYTPYNNFQFTIDMQIENNFIGGWNGHGKVTSNNRAFIGISAAGKIQYGSGAASGEFSTTDVTPYNRHVYSVRTSSSSNGRVIVDNVTKWSGNSNYQESNRGTMFIGGVYRNTGDYGLIKQTVFRVDFINNASSTTNWVWRLIPCQRKSDGAIGFLKLKANGTTPDFLSSANGLLEAGPVLDEYWDMTNPF